MHSLYYLSLAFVYRVGFGSNAEPLTADAALHGRILGLSSSDVLLCMIGADLLLRFVFSEDIGFGSCTAKSRCHGSILLSKVRVLFSTASLAIVKAAIASGKMRLEAAVSVLHSGWDLSSESIYNIGDGVADLDTNEGLCVMFRSCRDSGLEASLRLIVEPRMSFPGDDARFLGGADVALMPGDVSDFTMDCGARRMDPSPTVLVLETLFLVELTLLSDSPCFKR